jgi:CheY-like chemotaxis protein/two-component sensor histidine kinase
LYENAEGNLNEKQIRYAKTIHSCGDDLIQLINDILDLSKIESGFISTNISTVRIAEIASFVETTFKPISEARNLRFKIETDYSLPASMETDIQRLNQILKNLLSNAFKFTEKGEVCLKIIDARGTWKPGNVNLDRANRVISFCITDTGIGIPQEKQSIIFEAFQQAEGSTSRKYGGTGLGLSISRGLAELLGGTIELESQAGLGSTFTLYLPIDNIPQIDPKNAPQSIQAIQQLQMSPGNGALNNLLGSLRITNDGIENRNLDIVSEMINETGDDRSNILPEDKVVMVVEDDLRFGKIVVDKAHEFDLKVIVATNYLEVFDFINRFSPIAITLDVKLPDTSGWKVIDLLRNDLTYRHIPIHVISGEENRMLALKRGARSFLLKPLDNDVLNELFNDIITYDNKKKKHLLVVEDNDIDSSQIAKIHQEEMLDVTIVTTGKDALASLETNDFDCIILDYTLPDISGTDLIHQVSKAKRKLTPVIVYSAKDFNKIELNNVNLHSSSLVVKGVNSIEHLLEETVSHLHINHKSLAPEKRRIIENIRNKEDILTGKNILVVDDDVRNLFALTTVFERFNINVVTAESGKEAISILNENPKIEMVLMDIMMPEMDGYETTQKIRREHKNSTLPIIAVTAKAMKGDRLKCIEAGASDYITKPVKIDQLLSLMRLWFCK